MHRHIIALRVVELEIAAVELAVRKCKLYLLGMQSFSLIVDHQALVSILDRKTLDLVENPKLQRLKERLSPYLFTTIWKKGKNHAIPDALSCATVNDPSPEDVEVTAVDSHHVRETFIRQIRTIAGDEKAGKANDTAGRETDSARLMTLNTRFPHKFSKIWLRSFS